jgi:copper chaperone CopZ
MAEDFSDRIIFTSSKIDSRRDVVRLEDELSGLEGVRDVTVDPERHTVEIIFDPTVISSTALHGQVEELGYAIDAVSEQERLPL